MGFCDADVTKTDRNADSTVLLLIMANFFLRW